MVNCDYFMRYPAGQIIAMDVLNEDKKPTYCSLEFEDENVVMSPNCTSGKFNFPNVPKDKMATVVCIRLVDDELFLAMKEIVVDKDVEDLEYKKVTLDELKDRLGFLNSENQYTAMAD
ncbi:MAG: hypothetical protein SH856_07845 [Flavobacteriales bacterium]|nr:hypothetical protein [Flavobacteriales bacterium]